MKVGRVETHLDRLDDKLASRLAEDVGTEAAVEPDTSPPGAVGLVVLELSRQEDGDENLEDGTLDSNDGNHAEDSVRSVPHLEVPQELEEGDHADDGTQWAMAAIVAPNWVVWALRQGPRKSEMRKRTRRKAMFQTMGPRAMMAIRRDRGP
jgi:hypothetical protein